MQSGTKSQGRKGQEKKGIKKSVPRLWLVVVECESEANQQQVEARLREMGIACSLRML
ncbi:MAG: hypothetical protein ACO1RA_20965 [Planctomycetaceae bacterium]